MYSRVITGAISGIESMLAAVEVDASKGMPGFEMVGQLSNEVREAKERVRVALKNASVQIPPMRITVSISPAEMRKEGASYDLPIAVGILMSLGLIPEDGMQSTLIVGELGLDGEVRAVKGVLPIVQKAKQEHVRRCIVPIANVREGAVIDGIEIIGVGSLSETIAYLQEVEERKAQKIAPARQTLIKFLDEPDNGLDFADINGQESVKRAVEVAAAGFHHILMVGPPGSGKTMIAKRIPTILPDLSREESLEVSTIYSVAGQLDDNKALITKRPFLDPHHTISEQALAGGGRIPKPGVISLAHRGVLFMDELPEFRHNTLEILRQPLEDKRIHIARTYGNFVYPADFMLVAAMNIATTKLIQCGIAEMPENKAFHGFCGCDFLLFRSAAALHGLFSLAILNLFLTIGRQSLNLWKAADVWIRVLFIRIFTEETVMITKEELKEVEGNYFEVLQAGAFAITLKSKNTGHYWHLLEREYPTFRHFVVYHKHNVCDSYHAQGTACDLAVAVYGIMSHDEFQMNGRKKTQKEKGKI